MQNTGERGLTRGGGGEGSAEAGRPPEAGRGAQAVLWDAQSPSPAAALRIASNGPTEPRAPSAAGIATAGSDARDATRSVLPGALPLPARRRPALPRPEARSPPTVSTQRPARSLAHPGPPSLGPFTWKLGESF